MQQIVISGDNLEILKKYPNNYFDAVVTDPPYGLGKEPDAVEVMTAWATTGYHEVEGKGFMGKEWDAFIPQPVFWTEVFRVLKHGGHVVAFYGTRTYDWGVMAMRFAGFEVRDCIQWLYGSGFPKSHNISKAIDKMYGAEREILGVKNRNYHAKYKTLDNNNQNGWGNESGLINMRYEDITAPATEEAKEWEGWGSALKPANEPIVLARKPLEKGLSIAENVLKWGTGGINIDGCRVEGKKEWGSGHINFAQKHSERDEEAKRLSYDREEKENQGRFPANIILTHHPECECKGVKKVKSVSNYKSKDGYENQSVVFNGQLNSMKSDGYADENGQETVDDWNCHPDCPIKILDEQSGISKSNKREKISDTISKPNINFGGGIKNIDNEYNDKGGASRFFYVAKASKSERNRGLDGFEEKQPQHDFGTDFGESRSTRTHTPTKNFHPTVKPVKLMQYLVRLVTPPNGKVLDPFCGSGTTGVACKLEGFEFVGIEQDPEYTKIAEARITNWIEEQKPTQATLF